MRRENKLPAQHGVRWNFIMNAILKMSAFIFPLITFPYVSRIIGAEGNGKITFASSVISYFVMFAQLGIPTYGIRVCASCRNDRSKLIKTVHELLILNSITVVISYVALAVAMMCVPRFQTDKTLLIITSASMLLNAIGMDWLFQALEQYSYITIRNLAFKILSVILMFALVHSPEDYVIYGGISVIGNCGSYILNFFYAQRIIGFHPVGKYNIKQHLRPALEFFMLTVSISVYTSMDSVMLGFISTDTEVGYYSAATKMKTILTGMVSALGGVMLPRMSNYIAMGKKEQFYALIKKAFSFVIIVTVPLTIYFCVMSYATIGLLAGDGYAGAVVPMSVITPTIILIGLSNLTGMQILVPTGREKSTTRSTIVGACVNLVVNAVAIPRLGATGAAIGTVAAEAVVLAVQIYFLRGELWSMIKGIQIFRILISNIVATVLLLVLRLYLPVSNYFLILLITASVFFGTYGIMLLLLKESFTSAYFWEYYHKISCRLRK